MSGDPVRVLFVTLLAERIRQFVLVAGRSPTAPSSRATATG